MKLKAQAQASTNATGDPPPCNRDAKSSKLPAFVDEKDELNSYLLRFEHYARMPVGEKIQRCQARDWRNKRPVRYVTEELPS